MPHGFGDAARIESLLAGAAAQIRGAAVPVDGAWLAQ
jgi:hypothetical protein